MATNPNAARAMYPLHFLRAALALVFLAFGYVKFFPFEIDGVEPLIAAHPLLAWMLPLLGKAGASAFLGVVEISAGILLLLGYRSVVASLAGGALTLVTFFITATLFFFLPGVFEPTAGGFPAISGTGGFLLKDTVLFSAGLIFFVDALERLREQRSTVGKTPSHRKWKGKSPPTAPHPTP